MYYTGNTKETRGGIPPPRKLVITRFASEPDFRPAKQKHAFLASFAFVS